MSDSTWLTKDAYDRLQAELKDRTEVKRPEIAKRIDAARQEGDLKENGGYHAAREEQGLNEARIKQLEALLRDAEVGETPKDDGIVSAGKVVKANIAGMEMTFLLGTREASEGLKVDVFSPDSPLGKAVLGHKVGETVEYAAPNGSNVAVKINEAKPFEA